MVNEHAQMPRNTVRLSPPLSAGQLQSVDYNLPNSVSHLSLQTPLFRQPRMVARSSVNSKRLSNNLSVCSAHTDSQRIQMPSMPRSTPNNTPLIAVKQNHEKSVVSTADYRRPVSTPLVSDRSTKLPPYTCAVYPDSLGNPQDDAANLLNIDDLLIRRNRSSNKLLVRTRCSRDSQIRPAHSATSPTPVISYQENAINTKLDLPMLDDDNERKRSEIPHSLKPVVPVRCPPARVELMLIFVKIGQVDTVNERYQADIFLQARWREPLLDATWNTTGQTKNWRSYASVQNPMMDLTPKRHLHTVSATLHNPYSYIHIQFYVVRVNRICTLKNLCAG
ncbi:hypothetical protein AHF37_04532 [Paragonimus kellicotti]|nr:hypothetical protein AHF37_04532 [Paragonimus kellicotti]